MLLKQRIRYKIFVDGIKCKTLDTAKSTIFETDETCPIIRNSQKNTHTHTPNRIYARKMTR